MPDARLGVAPFSQKCARCFQRLNCLNFGEEIASCELNMSKVRHVGGVPGYEQTVEKVQSKGIEANLATI